MKTIGILGGMSWESTALYYRMLNEGVKARLGGLHSAKIAMLSVDFHEIEKLQAENRWEEAGNMLADAGTNLKAAGADFLIIATNTMHMVAPQITETSGLPLLHIADATGERLQEMEIKRVALLGTAYTMEKDFYKGRLSEKFDLDVMVPDAADRMEIHHIIYEELCLGIVNADSRQRYLQIVYKLKARGAEAVILGCTEIGMLISKEFTDMPLLDTTAVHAATAVDWALSS